ncbi:hypothetical protein RQP46_002193 [Phenoliferia psychrophenolica]
MASHATTTTRFGSPYLPATCPYCSSTVEYVATPSADDQLKLACASCEKRFLVNISTAKTTPLTLRFPPELLSTIIALAATPTLLNDCYTSLLSLALVSRDWNEATNSTLYGTIARQWDSRVAKLLMRTFDERPALLQLFRSFQTYFPDLSKCTEFYDEASDYYSEVAARLPDRIASLEGVSFGDVDHSVIRLVLDRAPNLTYVNGGLTTPILTGSPPMEYAAPLVHLREVVLGQMVQPPPYRGQILSRTTSTLRHLTIGVYSPDVEHQISSILPTSPLDTLILIRGDNFGRDGGEWSSSLAPPLISYISSSPIQHLSLCCCTTPQLLAVLPVSLISLETVWPSGRGYYGLSPVADEWPTSTQAEVIRSVTKATTRLTSEPYVPVTCPYCSTAIEYLATPSADDQLKLACASCEKRFLVNMTTGNTTPLTAHLPPELLSAIVEISAPPSLLNDNYTSLLSFALVSRDWNEATNSSLYSTIARKWDSRIAKLLMRTFDERPALLQLFRSFNTYFPDLTNWVSQSSPVWKWKSEELQKLRSEAAYTTQDVWDEEDRARVRQAGAIASRRWKIHADETGAGEWIDPTSQDDDDDDSDREPEPRRREGAITFIDFLSRCPNLQSLEIGSMSMGRAEVDDKALDFASIEARLPHQIPSLKSVRFSNVDDSVIRLILDRAPNLVHVDGGFMPSQRTPGTENVAPLVHLCEVVINQIMRPPRTRGLVLSRTTSALRHLTIGVNSPAVESALPSILPTSPLDSLILIRGTNQRGAAGGDWTASLAAPLLSYISSSSIQHLFLSCPTTRQLLATLPVSLVSLETVTPSSRIYNGLGPWVDDRPELSQIELRKRLPDSNLVLLDKPVSLPIANST